ncbi:hypothetical protein C8R45DRAFT_367290 [Mycena sanguinolenta]|nr:hypothetical protein C8R45DRAFT_367290 [Mycena sanguinolenta]
MTEGLSDVAIQHEIWRYLIFIPFAIVVYEYTLTLQLEVSRYWGTGLNWGTSFFYLNRYSALFGTVPLLSGILLTTTDPSKTGICQALQSYHQYFAMLSQIIVAVMLIIRTYALYERNKYILALTICVTLAVVGFALYIILSETGPDILDPRLQALGCPAASPHDMNLRTAAAWSGLLIFDVMIFLLTIYKALRHERRRGSLLNVMFRDGSIYFGIMVVANAGNISTYTHGGPIISGSGTTLVNVLSSVMLTRLMLNLRDPRILRVAQRSHRTRITTSQDLPVITTLIDPYLGNDIELASMQIYQPEADEDSTDHRMHINNPV